ncbi:hypothetical protein PIB30_073834 [Stylosanthes scabra]|uniref:Uncharacterized protein n=1 Tax=Stylosanthes scabra TaxID=79078 RepID=A0ABU6SQ16_9FABA|nr:hypothetical protein [Stylosanthes scabra]
MISTHRGITCYDSENRDKKSIQFDPEIEKTLQRLRKQSKFQQETLEEDSQVEFNMADNEDHIGNQRRTLGDYTIPTTDSCGSSIVRPTVIANNFELKPFSFNLSSKINLVEALKMIQTYTLQIF